MTTFTLVPITHSYRLRRLKQGRTPERVLMSLRQRIERRLQGRDVAYSMPRFDWDYDQTRKRATATIRWEEALLPTGSGLMVIKPAEDVFR